MCTLLEKKIKCVRVKKERKKRGSVHWMEGRPWKKKREVLALLYWFCVYRDKWGMVWVAIEFDN